MTPTLHTTAQAAQLVGLSERQVRHLAGKLGLGTRLGKRVLMFTADDIKTLEARPKIGTYLRRGRLPQ